MTKLALTQERAATIEAAREEWLAHGLSTAPADFETAEAAISRLYERIGKKRPYFVRLSSPLGAELYINLLCQTWPKLAEGGQLWDQLRGQLRDQLWDQLRDQLGGQLGGQLWGQLRGQLEGQLEGQLWDQLGGQLRDQLRDQLGGQLRDQLGDQLGDQLMGQLWGQLGGQNSNLRFMGTWFYGAWDYLWGWLDGGRRVGAVYPPALNDALDDHCAVSRSVGWWYPFNDFCILTDRPEIIRRDADNRLHAEDGPALRYRDGYSLWALAGLPVTQQLIETPETLTFSQVRDERNAEIRRHMLDRFAGLRGSAAAGAWLKAGDLEPISQVDITDKMQPSGLTIWKLSNGDAPVLCKLYRADLPDDEPLVLIWVVCTSTAKEVFLRVPPNMTDAAEARDWTFPGVRLAEAVET
ncbi:MAG TPA: hypothetical protein VIO94_15765 [Phenylobacterium sp.]